MCYNSCIIDPDISCVFEDLTLGHGVKCRTNNVITISCFGSHAELSILVWS